MLFRPELHEPLTERAWDDERAGEALRGIVRDADANFDPDGLWPAEEWDSWQATPPLRTSGAPGSSYALRHTSTRSSCSRALS